MKTKHILVLLTASAFLLLGCKGTNEKRGDEHLEAGRYQNAINSYLTAKDKGKISDEFYDNFTLALAKRAEQECKKDPQSDLLHGLFEQALQNLDKVQNPETAGAIAEALSNVGLNQATAEGAELGNALDGFAKIDSSISLVKRLGGDVAKIQALRTQAENLYVARNLPMALEEDDPVAKEYNLLAIELVAKNNAELKSEHNKSLITTRPYFLIFGENIPNKSPLVDRWGYVMAFPTIKIAPTSLTGELQFWASTGNNTDLDPTKIKLVSTKGDSVFAKQVGKGWCDAEVIVGKGQNQKIEKKQKPFTGIGKLRNEFQCSVNVSFTYSNGFVPDYVEYKDQFGIGRKYLGQ
jgi:hypothetical protein